eukprot:gene16419-22632_t
MSSVPRKKTTPETPGNKSHTQGQSQANNKNLSLSDIILQRKKKRSQATPPALERPHGKAPRLQPPHPKPPPNSNSNSNAKASAPSSSPMPPAHPAMAPPPRLPALTAFYAPQQEQQAQAAVTAMMRAGRLAAAEATPKAALYASVSARQPKGQGGGLISPADNQANLAAAEATATATKHGSVRGRQQRGQEGGLDSPADKRAKLGGTEIFPLQQQAFDYVDSLQADRRQHMRHRKAGSQGNFRGMAKGMARQGRASQGKSRGTTRQGQGKEHRKGKRQQQNNIGISIYYSSQTTYEA